MPVQGGFLKGGGVTAAEQAVLDVLEVSGSSLVIKDAITRVEPETTAGASLGAVTKRFDHAHVDGKVGRVNSEA